MKKMKMVKVQFVLDVEEDDLTELKGKLPQQLQGLIDGHYAQYSRIQWEELDCVVTDGALRSALIGNGFGFVMFDWED